MEQSSGIMPPLCKDGTIYEENIDKANLRNDYFSNKTTLPQFISRNRHSLKSIHTNPHKVEETLNSLSVEKAAGLDGINKTFLKHLSRPFPNPLSDLFNFSLVHG